MKRLELGDLIGGGSLEFGIFWLKIDGALGYSRYTDFVSAFVIGDY